VDHGSGGSDDYANALAGCLVSATGGRHYGMLSDAVLDLVPGQSAPGYLTQYLHFQRFGTRW
jgi:hypothetical protein